MKRLRATSLITLLLLGLSVFAARASAQRREIVYGPQTPSPELKALAEALADPATKPFALDRLPAARGYFVRLTERRFVLGEDNRVSGDAKLHARPLVFITTPEALYGRTLLDTYMEIGYEAEGVLKHQLGKEMVAVVFRYPETVAASRVRDGRLPAGWERAVFEPTWANVFALFGRLARRDAAAAPDARALRLSDSELKFVANFPERGKRRVRSVGYAALKAAGGPAWDYRRLLEEQLSVFEHFRGNGRTQNELVDPDGGQPLRGLPEYVGPNMKIVDLGEAAVVSLGRLVAETRGGEPQTAEGRACLADFERVESVVREDYAGFRHKTAGREAELAAFTEDVRTEVRAAANPDACTEALRRWTGFFRDRHLAVSETRPRPAAAGPAGKPADAPAEDPDRPTLRFHDSDAAVLRLPSFGNRHKAAVDKLIEENRARLLATPYLVVDVRGNGGGWTEVYQSVVPLLYTDPIFQDGMDAWASPGNTAAVRELLASPQAPEAMKAQARGLLARMEASPGQFVTMAEDAELRLDAVTPMPRAVALLVDRQCASTCEQFVLDARQSRKVKVLGAANTGGLLDYGNARTVPLPSGQRRLHAPVTRSRRLPASPLDLVGIAPDVRVRGGEADPVAFALRYLRGAPEKGR